MDDSGAKVAVRRWSVRQTEREMYVQQMNRASKVTTDAVERIRTVRQGIDSLPTRRALELVARRLEHVARRVEEVGEAVDRRLQTADEGPSTVRTLAMRARAALQERRPDASGRALDLFEEMVRLGATGEVTTVKAATRKLLLGATGMHRRAGGAFSPQRAIALGRCLAIGHQLAQAEHWHEVVGVGSCPTKGRLRHYMSLNCGISPRHFLIFTPEVAVQKVFDSFQWEWGTR